MKILLGMVHRYRIRANNYYKFIFGGSMAAKFTIYSEFYILYVFLDTPVMKGTHVKTAANS